MDEKDLENNMIEEESNIVVLKDEEGNDVKFEFLDSIEYEGENYVVLLPVEGEDDSDEVIILREDRDSVLPDSDEESYLSVEDEDVLNNVFEIFKEKFKDEFDFEE